MKKRSSLLTAAVIMLMTNFLCAQPQTITYSTGKTFDEFKRTDYMGSFCVIYYVTKDNGAEVSYDLSYRSCFLNDSVIKSNVKRINHAAVLLPDSVSSGKIQEELLKVITYAKDKGTIKSYRPDSILYKGGVKTPTDYCMYFVSAGFIKDSVLLKNEKMQRIVNNIASGLFAITVGVATGGTVVPIVPFNFSDNGKDPFPGKSALNGYIIIYDKKKHEVCFYREQFFTKNKNPLEVKNIRKQIKSAFKENFD